MSTISLHFLLGLHGAHSGKLVLLGRGNQHMDNKGTGNDFLDDYQRATHAWLPSHGNSCVRSARPIQLVLSTTDNVCRERCSISRSLGRLPPGHHSWLHRLLLWRCSAENEADGLQSTFRECIAPLFRQFTAKEYSHEKQECIAAHTVPLLLALSRKTSEWISGIRRLLHHVLMQINRAHSLSRADSIAVVVPLLRMVGCLLGSLLVLDELVESTPEVRQLVRQMLEKSERCLKHHQDGDYDMRPFRKTMAILERRLFGVSHLRSVVESLVVGADPSDVRQWVHHLQTHLSEGLEGKHVAVASREVVGDSSNYSFDVGNLALLCMYVWIQRATFTQSTVDVSDPITVAYLKCFRQHGRAYQIFSSVIISVWHTLRRYGITDLGDTLDDEPIPTLEQPHEDAKVFADCVASIQHWISRWRCMQSEGCPSSDRVSYWTEMMERGMILAQQLANCSVPLVAGTPISSMSSHRNALGGFELIQCMQSEVLRHPLFHTTYSRLLRCAAHNFCQEVVLSCDSSTATPYGYIAPKVLELLESGRLDTAESLLSVCSSSSASEHVRHLLTVLRYPRFWGKDTHRLLPAHICCGPLNNTKSADFRPHPCTVEELGSQTSNLILPEVFDVLDGGGTISSNHPFAQFPGTPNMPSTSIGWALCESQESKKRVVHHLVVSLTSAVKQLHDLVNSIHLMGLSIEMCMRTLRGTLSNDVSLMHAIVSSITSTGYYLDSLRKIQDSTHYDEEGFSTHSASTRPATQNMCVFALRYCQGTCNFSSIHHLPLVIGSVIVNQLELDVRMVDDRDKDTNTTHVLLFGCVLFLRAGNHQSWDWVSTITRYLCPRTSVVDDETVVSHNTDDPQHYVSQFKMWRAQTVARRWEATRSMLHFYDSCFR